MKLTNRVGIAFAGIFFTVPRRFNYEIWTGSC